MSERNEALPAGSFQDVDGREWTPQITNPVLLKAGRKLGLSLQEILALQMPFDKQREFIWLTVEHCHAGKIGKLEFMNTVGPDETLLALKAVEAALVIAFPKARTLVSRQAEAAESGQTQT